MLPLQFDGIQKTLTITNNQIEEFSRCEDEDLKILSLKNLAEKVVPLYKLYEPLDAEEGMTARDFAQWHVLENTCLFSFFVKLFPDLSSSSSQMHDLNINDTDDLIVLEKELTSLFKRVFRANKYKKKYGLYLEKIEKTFASSDEKKKLAYKVLVKTCDSLDCLCCWVGNREEYLYRYILECACRNEFLNEFLILETLRAIIAKKRPNVELNHDIEYLGLKDEKLLIEIAKYEANGSPWHLSRCIENYGIQDQEALFEIAKIAMTIDRASTSRYIQNFGLKEEKARLKIAEIFLSKYDNRLKNHLWRFGINNTKNLLTLFLTYLECSPLEVIKDLHLFKFSSSYENLHNAFFWLNSYKSKSIAKASKNLIKVIQEQKWGNLETIFKEQISNIKNHNQQKIALLWFAHLLGRFILEETPTTHINYLINNKLIQQAFVYRDLFDPFILTKAMLSLENNEVALSYMEGAFSTFKKNHSNSKLETIPSYARLPLLVLSLIHSHGVSKKICDAHFAQVCTSFKEGSNTRSFKDGRYLRIYLNVLCLIAKNTELDLMDKEYLLDKILKEYLPVKEIQAFQINTDALDFIANTEELDQKEKEGLYEEIIRDYLFTTGFEEPQLALIPNLRTSQAIHGMGKMSNLKKSRLEQSTLRKTLQETFQSIVPVKPIANFSELYFEHFLDKARIPNYITVYASNLSSLGDEDGNRLLKTLASCIDDLFEGTFRDKRYDLSASRHLQVVFRKRLKLLEEWKKGESADLAPFLTSSDQEKEEIDFYQKLKSQINNFGHLDKVDAPYLKAYLKGSDTYVNSLEKLSDALQGAQKDNPTLLMQAKCIQLTNVQLTIKQKQQLLREIEDHLREIDGSNDFANDIKSFRIGLQKQYQQEEKYDGYKIVDTDDFQDLSLSGTEVPGSCLRIDGDVDNNKCLLGIVKDGKNRLLAIKDREEKIVARHIFRILLEGSNDHLCILVKLFPSLVLLASKDQGGRIVAEHILNILLDGITPVLFLEKLYPALCSDVLKFALELFAKKRANMLGLKLLIGEEGQRIPYEKPIESLGSLAPFEYSDATSEDHVTNGHYTITNARLL